MSMKLPFLGIDIINDNLKETLGVLQGISRYVHSIFIREELVQKEGPKVLTFLLERYPDKNIVLNISDKKEKDNFIESVIKETNVKSFVLNGTNRGKKFEALCSFLKRKKKKIIFCKSSPKSKIAEKFRIQNFFYFKPENKINLDYWNQEDLKKLKQFRKKKHSLIVGSILAKDIKSFKQFWIDEFLVCEEVCYSFNPIETCKAIYSEIKKNYTKKI